ncbi:MAG: glucose-1-phosphate adenylyltransferase subunit GlgD [candidate division Zixibacteria bacterium]|nr:glucose-1-phosphate adenylyltransferase subunit GlgD [candidate division Zixibacteria bacterium]
MPMRNVLATILAGGKGDSLLALSRVRATASVPFAGHYRLIDFALSNCTHSGITNVGVLTQYLPASLKAHIGIGKPWDFDRRDGGVRLLEPYYRGGELRWYRGTGDALAQNVEVIDDRRFDHVVVTAGDLVHKMDYRPLLDFHAVARAGVTLVVKKMPAAQAGAYDAVELGRGNVVKAYGEAAPRQGASCASVGLYVFDRPFLVDKLRRMKSSGTDLVNEIIVPAVGEGAAAAYGYDGYWARIDTVDDYYAVTFECLTENPPCSLDDPRWPIYTRLPDDPPVKLGPNAEVHNSLIADGSIINGLVENSVIFRRVYVEKGACVKDSIVMDGARVETGASVDRAILDKLVRVGAGARVGADVGEPRPNEDFPGQLSEGTTLVAKAVKIPPAFAIGRNCLLDIGTQETAFEHFPGRAFPNGASAGVID